MSGDLLDFCLTVGRGVQGVCKRGLDHQSLLDSKDVLLPKVPLSSRQELLGRKKKFKKSTFSVLKLLVG